MALRLVQRTKGGNWYIRGSVRGIRIAESTGLSNKRKAEAVLAKRSNEIWKESVFGKPATVTFAQAAASYASDGGDSRHLSPLIRFFGERKIGSIGQSEIEAAARKLKPGASPATINRQIFTPTSAVLHYAARRRWCEKPALARPSQPPGRVRWITPEEAEALIAAAAPHLKPLVIFLLSTGARVAEALYLDWQNVDLERRQVQFLNQAAGGPGTKNNKCRGVPLHSRAIEALMALPHRSGAVFRRPPLPNDDQQVGQPYSDRRGLGGGQLKTAWKGMVRRAGIADFTPHDCRHTWASWHYMANRDLNALMALGGWSDAQMVLRYAHMNVAHLAPTIETIWLRPDH